MSAFQKLVSDTKTHTDRRMKRWTLQHQHLPQMKMYIFVLISSFVSFWVCIYVQYSFDAVRNHASISTRHNKKSWKVHEKNMSQERASNFDRWKTFSENDKPMRVWLWLVCKIIVNNCHSQLLAELIQT